MAEKLTMKALSEELASLRERLLFMEKSFERKLEKTMEKATEKLKARIEHSQSRILPPRIQSGPVDAGTRRRMIEQCAYFRAERRQFTGGSPDEDWHAAELEIDHFLIQELSRSEEPETAPPQTLRAQDDEKRV